MMDTIDIRSLSRADAYAVLSAIVLPRPIAFVTTLSPERDGKRIVNGFIFGR